LNNTINHPRKTINQPPPMNPSQRLTLILALVLLLCALGLALLLNQQHTALRATQAEIVAELRLLRTAQLKPDQVREAVMHGTVDADEEKKRRVWKHEEDLAKFRAEREAKGGATSPTTIEDALQRAQSVARGQR